MIIEIQITHHSPGEEPYPYEAHVIVDDTLEGQRALTLQNRLRSWIEHHHIDAQIQQWRVYFRNEEDLDRFALRWS